MARLFMDIPLLYADARTMLIACEGHEKSFLAPVIAVPSESDRISAKSATERLQA